MKEQEITEQQIRLEKALYFIEDHLKSPLTLDQVAEAACYSKFHLIKIFQALTGETVMDYLRKRRISEAGTDLIKTDQSILEIAMTYQFESQEAFTRAFSQVFGMPPGKFRKKGHRHVAFERYMLSPADLEKLANFSPMEPRIVDIEPKLLVGMHTRTCLADNRIPDLWKSFMPRRNEVAHKLNDDHYFAVHRYAPDLDFRQFTPQTVYDSWASVEVSKADEVPEGIEKHRLSGGKYAVFIYKGPVSNFPKTWQYIHYEWLPSSGYELDQRDHFEILGPKYHGPSHPDSEEEIWIPINLIS